jgi:hypothetical protein
VNFLVIAGFGVLASRLHYDRKPRIFEGGKNDKEYSSKFEKV